MSPNGRALIVDNYDSFTFNLAHQFEEVIGVSPVVVKNDESNFIQTMQNSDLTDHYDLIILSPGPGHPETDVGPVTAFVIDYYFGGERRERYPTLFGVCMGYEAIGVKLGVPVLKGVPRHGVRFDIQIESFADQGGLFRDLPSRFKVVRYHSLILDPEALRGSKDLLVTSYCVDSSQSSAKQLTLCAGPTLPDSIAPDWLSKLSLTEELPFSGDFAETKIQIPMSFRHRSLPVYGVQFHPESILSEYGLTMMRNICAIAGLKLSAPKIQCFTPPLIKGSISTKLHQLDLEDIAWWPFSFYSQMVFSNSETSIWLDSPYKSTGRWSIFAGHNIGGLWSVYEQKSGLLSRIEGEDFLGNLTPIGSSNCLKRLTELIESKFGESERTADVPISVPCVLTVMGYEAMNPELTSGETDAYYMIADRVIALDNQTGFVFAVHTPDDTIWLSEFARKLRNISNSCPAAVINPSHSTVAFRTRDSKSSYLEKIKKCQTAIELGEAYELCLTTKIEAHDPSVLSLDPLTVYHHLRTMNPAHNSCFFNSRETSLLMASPERFLKVDGVTGIAEMKPIKGTRPRGRTEEEDSGILKELSKSEKDFSENLMIVDLVRNDLSTVCHNVCCPKLMQVETYAPYHQLVSTVQGQLPNRLSLTDVVLKLFPAGSMTGAPKVRSIQILAAVEGGHRGLGYSGAVGYLCPRSGDADLAVTIRSIFFEKTKVSIGCGGAILALSDPEEEWREVMVKARRSLQVIAAAAGVKGVLLNFSHKSENMFVRGKVPPGERIVTTMRYEEGKGFWLFDRHMYRLINSLESPSLRFDEMRNLIMKAIQNKVSRIPEGGLSEFATVRPLEEGPFPGISGHEWEPMKLVAAIKGARIRVEINTRDPTEVACTILPLVYDNPESVKVSSVLVDSTDTELRKKSADWYVPSDEKRENTILVNDQGFVTETGISNILVQRGARWITPCDKENSLLPGTLRAFLLERNLVQPDNITLSEITNEDTMFCFNGVRGFYPVKVV